MDIWWLPVGVSGPRGPKIHSGTHGLKWSSRILERRTNFKAHRKLNICMCWPSEYVSSLMVYVMVVMTMILEKIMDCLLGVMIFFQDFLCIPFSLSLKIWGVLFSLLQWWCQRAEDGWVPLLSSSSPVPSTAAPKRLKTQNLTEAYLLCLVIVSRNWFRH